MEHLGYGSVYLVFIYSHSSTWLRDLIDSPMEGWEVFDEHFCHKTAFICVFSHLQYTQHGEELNEVSVRDQKLVICN